VFGMCWIGPGDIFPLGGEGHCSAWHERVPIQNLFAINKMKPGFICVNMFSALPQRMCKPDWSDSQVMCEKYHDIQLLMGHCHRANHCNTSFFFGTPVSMVGPIFV